MSTHLVTLSIHIPDSKYPENHSEDFIKGTLEEGIEELHTEGNSWDCLPWEVTVAFIQSES